ncbi:MAG: right-handed parallel beta-helix repeat-containing protein [Archaeoglobaceae archaeon]
MTGSGSGKGILIQANNVTIANVNASAYDYGIYLSSSNNSTIANCYTLNNDETGIYLNYTTNSTIANNTVSNNNQAQKWNSGGIVLYNSNYNKILENRITNNKFIGINVIDSHNNSFTANQILYNYGPTTVGGVAPEV